MKLNMLLNEMKAEGKAEGMEEGMEKGMEKGDQQAENRVSRLMKLLISKGKQKEALEASTDEKLRKKLYAEYGI